MKKITYLFLCVLVSCSCLCGCSKDEILSHYNNIIQSAGNLKLTSNHSLVGTREYGVDHYTGKYIANYDDFSKTEYLFGGTSIDQEHSKEITISCHLEITEGTAKIFWVSGSDDPTILFNTDGDYTKTLTLPAKGNYIGIVGENFTGSLELNIK